jgi:hypothetical protein
MRRKNQQTPVKLVIGIMPRRCRGSGRHDSPWCATMTLYRQKSSGDWTDFIASVKSDLA